MGIEWYDVNSSLSFGIDWQYAQYETYVEITPIIYRWDRYNTDNYGGRFDEALNPDANNGNVYKEWTGLSYGSGSGTRQIDSFAKRRYYRGSSDVKVRYTIWWYNTGTYNGGWIGVGDDSYSWTVTVPKLSTWNVTYDANGGSPTPEPQQKKYNSSLTLTKTIPTREDAVFYDWGLWNGTAWAYYANGGAYTDNAAANFKARWRPSTTITFDANGGAGAPSKQVYLLPDNSMSGITPDTNLASETISCLIPNETPTKENCLFAGWKTSGSATVYNAGSSYSLSKGQVTFVAQWNESVSTFRVTTSQPKLGSNVDITVTRKSNSYRDVITYSAGSYSGTMREQASGGSAQYSFTWVPGIELANSSSNSMTVDAVITVNTYNGDTLLGSISTSVPLSIPEESVSPLITGIDDSDANGYKQIYGGYIQNCSQIRARATGCEAQYGATVASIRYDIAADRDFNNVLESISKTKTTQYATFTMAKTVANSGSAYLRATITDSRGLSTTTNFKLVTIRAYAKPIISNLAATYYSGVEDPISLTYHYTFSYSFSDDDEDAKNVLSETVRYKVYDSQSQEWNDAITVADIEAESSEGNFDERSVALDPNQHYLVNVMIADSFGNSSNATVELITSNYEPIIDLYKNTGVALGKVASEDGLTLGPDNEDAWDLNIGRSNTQHDNLLYRQAGHRNVEFIDLPLPISQGGTGGTTVAEAKHNLNISDSAVIPNLPSAPTNPVLGELYYDTTTHDLMICTDPGNPPSVPATWASLSDVTGGVIKDIDGTSPINVSIAQDGTASLSLSATSSTATPSFGDTFETLSAPVSGGSLNGQLTKSTITIPSNAATTALAGLMSAADKGRLDNLNLAYATCDTAANAQTKIATVQAGTFALTAGALVAVKFTYTNTYDATSQNHVRLNVDDSGSKSIYYADGLPIGTNEIAFGIADYVHLYMYDGTYWVWVAYSMENRYDTMTAADYAAGTSEIGMLISPKLLKDSITYIQDLIVNNVLANYAHISNGVIDNATISYADVNELSTHYASITNGVIDSARIGYASIDGLDTHYATINLSNIGTGVITTAMIADAAITDAKMGNISANKITSGTINAANINVLNLRTDNLLVTKVNGQPVLGGYIEVDKTDPTYANQNPMQNGWYELSNQNEFIRSTDTSVQEGKTYYATAAGGAAIYDQAAVDSIANNISTTLNGNITAVSNRVDTTVKSSIQLWRTRTAQQGAPSKPYDVEPNTQYVYTTDYQTPDIWTTVVPEYNASYPDYYYCWQYEYPTNPTKYGWSAVVKDIAMSETQVTAIHADTTATNAASTAEAAQTAVEGLQEQVDGMLEVWSGAVDPRPNESYPSDWTVPPASNWNTPALKNKHVGDLYYNTTDGTMWQWTYDSQTAMYSWADAPESIAAEALAIANGKRRVFTSQPFPPYDIGDLWVSGSEVRYAITAKTSSQQYSANDWELTATDDTAANAAQATANANIKSSIMLWYTNNSTTPPAKPTSTTQVSDDSTAANQWTKVVPVYASATPYYHYCYQQQRGDGGYQWTDAVYDAATSIAMQKAQSALPNSAWEEWQEDVFSVATNTIEAQGNQITKLTTHTIYGGANYLDDSESILYENNAFVAPYDGSTAVVYGTTTYGGEQAYYCSGPRYVKVNFPLLEVGTDASPIKYTFSFDCTRANAQPVFITIDGTTTNLGNTSSTSGEWKRFSHTFTSTANTTYALLRVNNANEQGSNNYVASFRYFKIERGELSTPWEYSVPDQVDYTQTTNEVMQTATSNSATISQLTTTLGTNADGTTKDGDIVHRTSSVEQDLSGFKTEVSETYATQTALSGVSTVANNANNKAVAYSATCATGATTAAKEAACTNFPTLAAGVTITIRFANANTSTGAITLNVNATGAKTVYVNGQATSSTNQLLWGASANITFTYDGTYWRVVSEPRTWYGTCSTAAATAAKAATIDEAVICKGTSVTLNMTYENTNSSATLNITSTGVKNLYYGTTSTRPTTANGYGWNAASTVSFIFDGQYWRLGDTSSLATISSHSTKIQQNADAIALKANATDVYTKDQVYTKSETDSAITVSADSITSMVSQTYTTKTDFNNLSIGARNLLMETATENNGIATSTTSYLARYKLSEPLTVNTEYVWGLDLSTSTKKAIRLYVNDNSSAGNAITDWITNNNSVLESKRYNGSFTATADMVAAQGGTNLNAYIAVYVSNNANGSGATYNSYSGNTNTQVSTAAGYIRTLNIQGKTDSSWRSIDGISVNTVIGSDTVSVNIPATIRSAGSIYDSLQVDKTNVTITRRVALMTFNGTEDWQKSVTTGGKPAFWLQNTVLPASLFVNKERYAAGYTTSTADWDTLGNMYIGVPYKATSGDNANAGVLFVNDAYSTVDEWKAALQASNVTISYATPNIVSDTVSNISNLMQIGTSVTVSTSNLDSSTSLATPFSMLTDDGTTVSHMKLEEGNRPTDWTTAPEELSNLSNNYTLFEQTANGFMSTASSQINGISAQMSEMNQTIIEQNSNFVQVSTYNAKMESIDESITDANTEISAAKQGISAANTNYASLNGQINGVEGESEGLVGAVNTLSKQSAKLGNYLKFDNSNFLTVGSIDSSGNESPMKVQITDTAINFIDGDVNNPVAYINQKMLYIENEQILKNLRFGNFVFFEREGSAYNNEGHNMGLKWVTK